MSLQTQTDDEEDEDDDDDETNDETSDEKEADELQRKLIKRNKKVPPEEPETDVSLCSTFLSFNNHVHC